MKLSTEHFFGQQSLISDDDFKTIVKESDCVSQIVRKCKMENGGNNQKILKRIADLDLDTSHFKTSKRTEYKLSREGIMPRNGRGKDGPFWRRSTA